jgi:hypothetical protein
MKIDPVPLEKLLRAETVSRSLHALSREELEMYTSQLLTLTVKLTHYTNTLKIIVAEMELGLIPEG